MKSFAEELRKMAEELAEAFESDGLEMYTGKIKVMELSGCFTHVAKSHGTRNVEC